MFDNALLVTPPGGQFGAPLSGEDPSIYFVLKNSNENQSDILEKMERLLFNAFHDGIDRERRISAILVSSGIVLISFSLLLAMPLLVSLENSRKVTFLTLGLLTTARITELKQKIERQFKKMEKQREQNVEEKRMQQFFSLRNLRGSFQRKKHFLQEELKEGTLTGKECYEEGKANQLDESADYSLQQMDSFHPLKQNASFSIRRSLSFMGSRGKLKHTAEEDQTPPLNSGSTDGDGNLLAAEINRQSCTNHSKNLFFVLLSASLVSCYFIALLVLTYDLENKRNQSIRLLEMLYHRDAVLS